MKKQLFAFAFVFGALSVPVHTSPVLSWHPTSGRDPDWYVHGAGRIVGGCATAMRQDSEREAKRRLAEGRRKAEARGAEVHRELLPRAEAGDPEASYRLGWHLYPKPEGLAWLCRAADRGHAQARYIIGANHELGFLSGSKDHVRAHHWYDLAAASGHARAAAERDKLASQMTAKELADSRRLTSAWRPAQCEAAIDRSQTAGSRSEDAKPLVALASLSPH